MWSVVSRTKETSLLFSDGCERREVICAKRDDPNRGTGKDTRRMIGPTSSTSVLLSLEMSKVDQTFYSGVYHTNTWNYDTQLPCYSSQDTIHLHSMFMFVIYADRISPSVT